MKFISNFQAGFQNEAFLVFKKPQPRYSPGHEWSAMASSYAYTDHTSLGVGLSHAFLSIIGLLGVC